ncbi:VOC family protein [Propionibacteriaceae bacterium Y1685]
MSTAVHHVELWTHALAAVEASWDWLFDALGWIKAEDGWSTGRVWHHPSGTYVVLEQSADVSADHHDRLAPGLNHLALTISSRALLDQVRDQGADHGWTELFGSAYPHAGGPDHTALFMINTQGFEIELVTPD